MAKTAKEKVFAYIRETGMLKDTGRVIAGVSGGADSVFLFYMLEEYCRQSGIQLEVVHVHHGIRGKEADRDAEYVSNLCAQYGVPCIIVKQNIPERAALRHETLEEAGRNARYEIFSAEAERIPGSRVAIAHHKNDIAETMLFNLARGTGLMGMSSLRAVRGKYIRPLLAVTREELEAYLTDRNISWCEDITNTEDDAARNRIRHHILPYMESEINAQSISHLSKTAEIAGEAADFVHAEALKRFPEYAAMEDGRVHIACTLVEHEPHIIQEEVIRIAVSETLDTLKDISELHIRLILELFGRETGKFLNLPKGLTAEKAKHEVILTRYSVPKKNTRKHGRVLQ